MQNLYNRLLYAWYQYPLIFILLWPISLIYMALIRLDRFLYQKNILKSYKAPCPVIVVGNFVVGGTGKTPMVIALAELLKLNGYKPGIVTRGYGSDKKSQNIRVTQYSDPKMVGDEAIMIALQTQCPIIKNKNRAQAAAALAQECDVIISDDGLQHHRLRADITIAMQPDKKWLKNNFCIPAGPWREPKRRVDFTLESKAIIEGIYPLQGGTAGDFTHKTVHAICAIGAPWRFFTMLNNFGIKTINHAFPDHYLFKQNDFIFSDELPILITEKDATKCVDFNLAQVWVVKIKTQLDKTFITQLLDKLSRVRTEK